MAASKYDYATEVSSNAGAVSRRESKTIVIDVITDPIYEDENPNTDYVITVNGRVVKRMNAYQAKRLGLFR